MGRRGSSACCASINPPACCKLGLPACCDLGLGLYKGVGGQGCAPIKLFGGFLASEESVPRGLIGLDANVVGDVVGLYPND